MTQQSSLAETVRRYYRAYETKDREAIEALLTPDFRFSSPLDDRIDRATYFDKCWPNSERTQSFDIKRLWEQDGEVFVHYELRPITGESFQNAELLIGDGNRIREVIVFFGRGRGTVGDNAQA
ncbi:MULTISPECIES: nuclear transport factor 2 family protein [unclassified Bradyrhizobium]|uniref:nuclear transport factor 2 family protein n=1 Tax=unclassified Bradyrhizobium TaxID=2631580 RepID=UPI001FF8474A|nr:MULTISPECIES: nuclear transport factor 2 family protein [unclassified Bradyrhizobium]MCK1711272.1 nuclear transport factor 2 family protein [Bradyrhizobium sp. 143]MCK1731494.1 nuclear transport factor 2 family protein [Bradyrhizobium sp. 142]